MTWNVAMIAWNAFFLSYTSYQLAESGSVISAIAIPIFVAGLAVHLFSILKDVS